VEDLYGDIEVIVFPRTFNKFRNLIDDDNLITVTGRVSIREDEPPKILCESIEPLVKINSQKLYILIEEEALIRPAINNLKKILCEFKGNTPMYICTKKERKKFRLDSEYWVKVNDEIIYNLKKEFGDDNIKLI
jgi:DNA polymerase-3 subunit alpha